VQGDGWCQIGGRGEGEDSGCRGCRAGSADEWGREGIAT